MGALTGKYPPKIRMYSKYERRTDTRTYEDRRKLYEGGWDVLYAELLEKHGKRRWMNGARDPRPSCPSGSVSVPVRSLVIPSLLMMKRMVLLNLQQKRKKKRKRRKKRKRNKSSRRSDKSSKRFTNHLHRKHFQDCSVHI